MKKPERWRKIASCDDDMISGELLGWSGLTETWAKFGLGSYFDFTRDIAEDCPSIEIDREEWDADMPGRIGTWHIVRTMDEEGLRQEMRDALARLLSDMRQGSRKDLLAALRRYREDEEAWAIILKERKESERRNFRRLMGKAGRLDVSLVENPGSGPKIDVGGWSQEVSVVRNPARPRRFLSFFVSRMERAENPMVLWVRHSRRTGRGWLTRYEPINEVALPVAQCPPPTNSDDLTQGIRMFVRVSPDCEWLKLYRMAGMFASDAESYWKEWAAEHSDFRLPCDRLLTDKFLSSDQENREVKAR